VVSNKSRCSLSCKFSFERHIDLERIGHYVLRTFYVDLDQNLFSA
jgi:hypothetical protein